MNEDSPKSTGTRSLVLVATATAALGVAAFSAWRNRAPLARSFRQSKREGRDRRPDPERTPGTDPM